MQPFGFSWVDPPHLAAMARPSDIEEFRWLRANGVQLLITLTETPPPRADLDEAGLLGMHVPVVDFHAPSLEQIEQCISAIAKAREQKLGVGIHCMAGLGRTGTILAAYFVTQGYSAEEAVDHVRRIRPSSIESDEQAAAVGAYALRRAAPPP